MSAARGDSSDADIHTYLMQKLQFFLIYGVSAWTRGVEPVRVFYGSRREGVNFSQFGFRDVFYIWLLSRNRSLLVLKIIPISLKSWTFKPACNF